MIDGNSYSGAHWRRYATSDSDLAHAYIRQAFVDVDVRFAADGPVGAGLNTITTQLGGVAVTRLHYRARTRVRSAPGDHLNIAHMLGGHYRVTDGKDDYRLRPGNVLHFVPDRALDAEFSDFGALVVRLPRALVEDVAGSRTGISPADLRFDHCRPISVRLGGHWSQTVSYLVGGVLSDPALAANPLIAGDACRLLAATALTVFPNTSLDIRPSSAGDIAPRAMRQAMAYADENAERPITVADMAAAAGVRPRALQLAFRRYRDTTPMRYARTVRLERAHRDLRAADPASGATVAGIAARWGFTHAGRFSSDYRAAYGVSPGHTLRT